VEAHRSLSCGKAGILRIVRDLRAEQFPVAGGGGDDALTPVSGRCRCWGCRNRPAWRRPAGATRWIVIACQPRNSPMGLVAAMPAG
jgi:hypothetical protein